MRHEHGKEKFGKKTCIGCGDQVNLFVLTVLGMLVFAGVLLILMGYVMDETARADRSKNKSSRYYFDGDGLTSPMHVDDPIAYGASDNKVALVIGTLLKVCFKEHVLLSPLFYHETFTRPQRILCIVAMVMGLLAMNAAVQSHPGYLQEAREYLVPGILSGLLVFPVFCMLLIMFNLRPAPVKRRLIKRQYATREIDLLAQQRAKHDHQTTLAPPQGYLQTPPPPVAPVGGSALLAMPGSSPLRALAGPGLPPLPGGAGASTLPALPALPGMSANMPMPPLPRYPPPPKSSKAPGPPQMLPPIQFPPKANTSAQRPPLPLPPPPPQPPAAPLADTEAPTTLPASFEPAAQHSAPPLESPTSPATPLAAAPPMPRFPPPPKSGSTTPPAESQQSPASTPSRPPPPPPPPPEGGNQAYIRKAGLTLTDKTRGPAPNEAAPLFLRGLPPAELIAPHTKKPPSMPPVPWMMSGQPPTALAPAAKAPGAVALPTMLPPPPPPPKEDDQAFIRRVRLTYMDKVIREHERTDILEDLEQLGKQMPSWVFGTMTLMPYLASASVTTASVFIVLTYGQKFEEGGWQEEYWYKGTLMGLLFIVTLLESFRLFMMTLVELRKFENRKKAKAGYFLPRRVKKDETSNVPDAPRPRPWANAVAAPPVPKARGTKQVRPLPALTGANLPQLKN
mmetsp:Transcript_35794/g.80829  ORF Transcript_35794/g.80829 Transcript_35794/m.80829 type:complete len:679 (+) Transcript_35794:3725-5761(+)